MRPSGLVTTTRSHESGVMRARNKPVSSLSCIPSDASDDSWPISVGIAPAQDNVDIVQEAQRKKHGIEACTR